MADIKLTGRGVSSASMTTPQSGDIAKVDVNMEVTGTLGIVASGNTGAFSATSLTGDVTYTLPDASGTLALTTDVISNEYDAKVDGVGTATNTYATIHAALEAGHGNLIVTANTTEPAATTVQVNLWEDTITVAMQSGVVCDWGANTWAFPNSSDKFVSFYATEPLKGFNKPKLSYAETSSAAAMFDLTTSSVHEIKFCGLELQNDSTVASSRIVDGGSIQVENCRVTLPNVDAGGFKCHASQFKPSSMSNVEFVGGGLSCLRFLECDGYFSDILMSGTFSTTAINFSQSLPSTLIDGLEYNGSGAVTLQFVGSVNNVRKTGSGVINIQFASGSSPTIATNIHTGGSIRMDTALILTGFSCGTLSNGNSTDVHISQGVVDSAFTLGFVDGTVTGVEFRGALTMSLNSDNMMLAGCKFSDTVTINSGATNCSFSSCYFESTLTDNGTGTILSGCVPTTLDTNRLDNSFGIADNGDTTKIAVFEASGITTATTRTFTFPDNSGTLALTTDVSSNVYEPYIQSTTAKTATFTAVLGETHIIDTSGGGFTANLPAIATEQGRIAFYFADTAGQLTLDPNASETIEGKTTIKLAQGHNTIENDGTEWKIVQRSGRRPNRLDPAQITADQNNYNPTDWVRDITHLFIDSDASRTLTGIEEDGFVDMDQVLITNDGSNDIIIANDSASSTAGNRILVDGGADFTLGADQSGILVRDGTVNKWRLMAISSTPTVARSSQLVIFNSSTSVTTGTGKAYMVVPALLNGLTMDRATAQVITAGTTNPTVIDVNINGTTTMGTTKISIASAATVATPGTITAGSVSTDDLISVDVDSVSTTAPLGLIVILEFS
jgi:hypothetical protein